MAPISALPFTSVMIGSVVTVVCSMPLLLGEECSTTEGGVLEHVLSMSRAADGVVVIVLSSEFSLSPPELGEPVSTDLKNFLIPGVSESPFLLFPADISAYIKILNRHPTNRIRQLCSHHFTQSSLASGISTSCMMYQTVDVSYTT